MRFRFGEPDREKYGDQWFEVNPYVLDWEREGMTGLVERFEDETGYTFAMTLPGALMQLKHRAQRAVYWWAVLLAGHDARFDDFDPRMDLIEVDRGNRSGPQSRATPKNAGKAGRSPAKRSASTSKTTN